MDTKHKPVEYFLCTLCPDAYIKVGGVQIGLAQSPRKTVRFNIDPNKQGPCPKHRKKLEE